MKKRILVILTTLLVLYPLHSASGSDHNNLDAGHPLSFDDAESIGFGEQAIELGGTLVIPSDRTIGGQLELEYLYGIIPNTHFQISIDPSFGGPADREDTYFDPGNLSVGLFHNFNREYNNTPAFATRADIYFPTGRDARGVDFRLRGIASKYVGQYDRLHINLDLGINTATDKQERSIIPGLILGYSRPIGYPYRFDRTFLAELGIHAAEDNNSGAVILLGIGLRQQVNYQGIIYLGLEGNIVTGNGEERSEANAIAGYSLSF